MAGAGTEECILAGFEQLNLKWPGILVGQFDFAEVLNEVVRDVSAKYVLKPEDAFSLIACDWIDGATKPLRLMKAPSLVPGVGLDFVSDGSGSTILRYVADGLYEPKLPLAQAVILAVNALRLAKKYAYGCGGESKIFTLDVEGRMDSVLPWDIRSLEQHFERFDLAIKGIVFHCADENIPDWKFDARLQQLDESLRNLRNTRKLGIEDRIDRFGTDI